MNVLLDSVIVIDYLNGITSAEKYVDEIASRHVVSAITIAEVLVGVDEAGFPEVTRFLQSFPVAAINNQTAVKAARLRQSHNWGLPDAFQAALAVQHDLHLATRNTRDFNPAVHPFVVVPYRL